MLDRSTLKGVRWRGLLCFGDSTLLESVEERSIGSLFAMFAMLDHEDSAGVLAIFATVIDHFLPLTGSEKTMSNAAALAPAAAQRLPNRPRKLVVRRHRHGEHVGGQVLDRCLRGPYCWC